MKKEIPTGAAIAAIVVIVALLAFFGIRRVSSNGSPDVTQENINFYKHGGAKPGGSAYPGTQQGAQQR